MKPTQHRKRTKSGTYHEETTSQIHRLGSSSSTYSNYKELKIYLGMCLFSSLFYFVIIQLNNYATNLTSLLNLNHLACKSSVFQFKVNDINDELKINFVRLFSSKDEYSKIKSGIIQTTSEEIRNRIEIFSSVYVLKWIVQSVSLFLLWYCFIIRRIDITNVGTCCDFLKELLFFITIAGRVADTMRCIG